MIKISNNEKKQLKAKNVKISYENTDNEINKNQVSNKKKQ